MDLDYKSLGSCAVDMPRHPPRKRVNYTKEKTEARRDVGNSENDSVGTGLLYEKDKTRIFHRLCFFLFSLGRCSLLWLGPTVPVRDVESLLNPVPVMNVNVNIQHPTSQYHSSSLPIPAIFP